MKELDKFIIESNGVLPGKLKVGTKLTGIQAFKLTPKGETYPFEQFQKRAKELGFVGKYRWGVEYKTDGKRPELDGNVVVGGIEDYSDHEVCLWKWDKVESFKITDQRYKPADTSYLDKPGSPIDNGAEMFIQNKVDWYDYKNKKGDIFPKAFDKVQFTHGLACWIDGEVVGMNSGGGCVIEYGIDTYATIYKESAIRPMNWNELDEAERKRVVDAAYREFNDMCHPEEALYKLYDKGFLRLPD